MRFSAGADAFAMRKAIFAFVVKVDEEGSVEQTFWMDRFPPELSEPLSGVWLLPRARALVAVQEEEGIFVYHISSEGELGSDTWHPSFEEAKHDVDVAFGASAVEQWTDVPVGIEDPVEYVAEQVRRNP
jgi:hypothetical protein